MVKNAFLDKDLLNRITLTSANSINVGRWLPQMFYFFFSYRDLNISNGDKIAYSVPSGNFGNICAGMLAKKIGLPIDKFIASNNINNVVDRYINTKLYQPEPSIQTISNAMDVGDPSNFIRISELYNNDYKLIKENLATYSFSDNETVEAIKELIHKYDYIPDPHGAIGYLGAKNFIILNPEYKSVILETAHPSKFPEVMSDYANNLVTPMQIKSIMNKEKSSIHIENYQGLKNYLIDS